MALTHSFNLGLGHIELDDKQQRQTVPKNLQRKWEK